MMNVITAFKSGNWNDPKCWKRGKDGVISGTVAPCVIPTKEDGVPSGTVAPCVIPTKEDGVPSGTISICGIPNQARCIKINCNKLLLEGFVTFTPTFNHISNTISIKCPRCKTMNDFLLSSYFTKVK
jgi:phage FluMu protein Com